MLKTHAVSSHLLFRRAKNPSEHQLTPVLLLLLLGLFFYSSATKAQQALSVSASNSQVLFSGEHVGMQFKGAFNKWDADLLLPPAQQPNITATFYVASAKTGDSTYDSTLPESDWFDVKNHPTAVFQSSQVIAAGNNIEVSGELTLKGISQRVAFTLIDSGKNWTATFNIDRLAHAIGLESDPDAEWVSKDIKLTLILSKQQD